MSKIGVIGAGFAGLSAACYLSAVGHEVHVFEKNAEAGGRARQLQTANGFVFDMGPAGIGCLLFLNSSLKISAIA